MRSRLATTTTATGMPHLSRFPCGAVRRSRLCLLRHGSGVSGRADEHREANQRSQTRHFNDAGLRPRLRFYGIGRPRRRTPHRSRASTTTPLRTVKIEVEQRQKQSMFRQRVMQNFEGRCCLSEISEQELLVASHIVPWAKQIETRLDPANGLLLYCPLDRLFDRGFITFDSELRVIVAPPEQQRSAVPRSGPFSISCVASKRDGPSNGPSSRSVWRITGRRCFGVAVQPVNCQHPRWRKRPNQTLHLTRPACRFLRLHSSHERAGQVSFIVQLREGYRILATIRRCSNHENRDSSTQAFVQC